MKRCYDPSFKYTPSKEMGPDYLKRKFARICAEQQAKAALGAAKVTAMPVIRRKA